MTKKLLILLLPLFFASCKKEKGTDNTGNLNLKDGTWRITYYWDQKDETANFSGYIFMFTDGGVLMAHKGPAFETGTWSETSNKLIINFTDPLLSDLNDDWLVTEKTATSIKLKDDNPARDDQLHLVKN
jgi:hypothetical protein